MSNVGALGIFGLAKEAAFGTYAAPTAFFPFSSEGFKDGPEALQELQIRGILDADPKYPGMNMVSGALSGVVYPDLAGHLLRAGLNVPVTTGAAAPYTHTFTPIQAGFSVGSALPSYTVVVARPLADGTWFSRQYTGCTMGSLSFKFTAGGLLSFDSSWMGQDSADVAKPAYSGPNGDPFQFSCAINRAGSALAYLQEYSISITNTLEALKLINNTGKIARIAWSGKRAVAFTGTADFQSRQLYDDFKAYGKLAWDMTHTLGANSLKFSLPAGLITDAGVALGGDGRVTLGFTGEGQYDTATSRALQVVLLSSVASY